MNDETHEPTSPEPRRRVRWLRREAINLGDFVVQIFAVVVGILLALFINNRVAERRQQHAVHEAMHSIHAELAANRATMRKNAAYLYRRATLMLDSPKNQDQPPRPCYLWDHWGGIGAINLTDAAYQTAITSQALAHMSFKQAQKVAQVYGAQHDTRKTFLLIRTNLLVAGPHTLKLCVTAIKSFASNEHFLSKAYTPLIGPDKTAWPKWQSLLSESHTQMTPSK